MKVIAKQVFSYIDKDKNTVVSFVCKDKYAANLFVKEVESLEEIEVTAKAYKESRSVQQNKFLWALITLISDSINHEHTEESTMKIYAELLVKAQVKRDLVAVLPQAVEVLQRQFRAVIPTYQKIVSINEVTGKKAELQTYWVYEGSSRFNTKEMNELLEITIKYADECGVKSSDVETIRREYE